MTKLNSISLILLMVLFGITVNSDEAFAKNSIYGRLDIALSNEDTSGGSYTDVKSHASRVGFKGSQTFDNGIAAIYQYEWQTDPIDGDPTFKQRNSLNLHISSFHENKRHHMCDVCNATFTAINGLKDHISAVHENIQL